MNSLGQDRTIWVSGIHWVLAGLSAGLLCGQPTLGRPRVAEIRFGVVEPPVVAQRDITVRAATSNQQLEQKWLECSGIAWLDGQLLISSDRHCHVIFTCPIDLNSLAIGLPEPQVIIRNEQQLLDDAECLTIKRQHRGRVDVYVMCSLSNDRDELPLPKRRHMLRFNLEQTASFANSLPAVLNVSHIRDLLSEHFRAVGVQPYRTYNADFRDGDKNTYRWGNVEGMSFTPEGSSLLCGMRNPMFAGRSLMFVVRGVEDAFAGEDPGQLELVDLFTLDMDGRGVSDLCWDPVTKGYVITAAKSNGPKLDKDQPFPPNTLDSALLWWSGRKSETPILFAEAPDMKIEAVCRLGSSPFIAICSDEGDVSEDRPHRQSVLTILYFAGFEAG
ncbi:MAG: hypothetical protein ACYTEX_07550 [Planctomycetota bacterium]